MAHPDTFLVSENPAGWGGHLEKAVIPRGQRETIPAAAVIVQDQVINLTPFIAADGKLTWTAPTGIGRC